VSDFDETYGSSVNARMASHAGEGPADPVDDLDRSAQRGDPPVEGAQWDEVHRRWEHWDEASGQWKIVGDDSGDAVAPREENPLPALLARELVLAAEAEETHQVIPDLPRQSPTGPAPRGAQWNEVSARWERWDEESASWVEATVDPEGSDGD
jgi:hypothetical protein